MTAGSAAGTILLAAMSTVDSRLETAATDRGELPESWCCNPDHRQYYNSPLCWSHALRVVGAVQLDSATARGRTPAGIGGAHSGAARHDADVAASA